MGCGMSKSNLMDEGMVGFGPRSLFHHKTDIHPPKLLIHDSSETLVVHQPPVLQKINIIGINHHKHVDHDAERNLNSDLTWSGSPSFREYIRHGPDDGGATKDDQHGDDIVIGTRGGDNMTSNREACVLTDSKGNEQAYKKDDDIEGGRFRKAVFHVHRVAFWHPKATRKAA